MDIIPGFKTYLAAAGLFGLAIYNLSQNDIQNAYTNFLAALALFGLRMAVARKEN